MCPSVSLIGAAALSVVLLLVPTAAAPTTTSTAAPAPIPPLPENTPLQPGEEFYDQRQNGSENYRIHMDGMVVVVAPPEALMSVAAGGQGVEQQIMDIVAMQGQAEDNDMKPGSKPGSPGSKPSSATNCQEGTPGCKKRRPALPAKSLAL